MYVLNGAHVQAAGGLDGDEQFGVLVDLAGHDGLLLVSAGHAARGGDGALAGADVVLLDELLGVGPDGLALEEARLDELRLEVPLEHHIVLQGVVQHQAVLMPVLGDVADARGGALADTGVGNVMPLEDNLSRSQGLNAGKAVDQLALAVAVDAGDADDLARTALEGDVLDGVVLVGLGGHGHTLHIQNHVAGLGGLLVHHEIHVPAHHHLGQFLLAGARHVHGADVLALAQDGAAVGHRLDLVELVGDEEDALALGPEAPHNIHQLVDLLGGEDGGGLVEDQNLIFAVEHIEDLGTLLHTDGDVLHQGVRVHHESVLLGEGHHLLPGVVLLQEGPLGGLHAHDDVVQDREDVHQLEVLVHHADSQLVGVVGILDGDLPAILFDDALLGLVESEEHAHQCGLAGAVFAQQRVDLTLFQLQRDIVVCDNAGKPLGDVQHFNGVWLFQANDLPLVFFSQR